MSVSFHDFLYSWLDGTCAACGHPADEHTEDGCGLCSCECWATFTPHDAQEG